MIEDLTSQKSLSSQTNKSHEQVADEIQHLRDLLARKEDELESFRIRNQSLSAAINIGYWVWDEISQKPLHLSAEMAAIFGLELEKFYQIYQSEQDLYSYIHPEDLDHYISNLSISLQPEYSGNKVHVFDYRIIRADGEVRYLRELEYAREEKQGKILRTYGAIQDITDYHRSWVALEESEQRYHSLFSKLPLGVMEQDWSGVKQAIDKLKSEGVNDLMSFFEENPDRLLELVDMIVITTVNDALLEIYRADSVEEYIQDEENVRDWWDEAWAKLYATEFVMLAGPERISYAELTETRNDGTAFETRLITSVVKGDEDSWKRILTIVEDVTERKHNEIELVKAKETAEKANKAKSEFLATMSHEIRTPMSGVLGMTELLMESEIDMQSRRIATTAHNSARSLLTIINDILDFSKIEADRMELFEEDFNLRELLENVVEIIAGLAHQKGLEYITSLPADLPVLVRGDALRFRQILINLLGNAVKFTETGEVRLGVQVKDHITDGFQIEIEVCDSGPGIPEERQNDIFDAFTQVEGGVSRRYEGTGLGLAITSRLVKLMHGDIELQSRPGAGALFRLNIPFGIASDNALSSRPHDDLKDSHSPNLDDQVINSLSGNRILLAEDNLVNQEVATGILNTFGCDVDIAANGIEALKATRANRYDLVLMDCHMPEMDGFKSSREIRRIEEHQGLPRVPIIAVTADIKKGIEMECKQAGMDGYLSKPFSRSQLQALLQQWLKPASLRVMPSATAIPSFNETVLAELKSLSDISGRDILGKSINFFVEQAPKTLALLKQAQQQNDLDTLKGIAHSLKSSSANLGAIELSIICQELEDLCREKSVQQIPARLQVLEGLLPAVLSELKQFAKAENVEADQKVIPVPEIESEASPTILIVDDDDAFRLTTSQALQAFGYQIIEASGGDEAMARLDQSLPDLVLLDAIMPNKDGFEVCRQIRDRFDVDTMPVVILTGLGDMQSVNRAFESGATDFIVKPVNYAVISSRIRFQLRVAENNRELKLGREQLASAQRVAGIGYWQWQVSTDRFTISEHLAEMLSLEDTASVATLEHFTRYIHPQDREAVRNNIVSATLGNKPESRDYRLITLQSKTIIVHQELNSRMPGGSVLGTIQDVTEQRESEKRIRQLAYTDTLTGLASRAYFHQHLEDVIRASHRRQERFALLFLDLDGFKDVNDSLGHETGDMLLREIASRLQGVIRDTDFVARLSGDEFCILVDNISEQYGAAYVAERCLHDINQPILLCGQSIRPRCSIGIAYFPDNGEDTRSLLKAADSAMYAAKESGKHCYVYYQPEFTAKAEMRLRTEQEMRQSIDKNELELLYQPQIDLGTGRMVGLEVLPVWNHPALGMMPQDEFVDIAERIGFIKPLTQWVIKNACRQAMLWKQSGLPDLRIAVNISTSYLWDTDFVDMISKSLAESGLPPTSLELEITESVTQVNSKNLMVFNQLDNLGVRVAIESYGSAFSSLSTLKRLPIGCLKIDRLFIREMLEDTRSSILLGTIIGAAHALGQIVIAEGVEDRDQLKVLAAIGCDLVQGDYLSKPLPEQSIATFVGTDFMNKTRQQDNLALLDQHTV